MLINTKEVEKQKKLEQQDNGSALFQNFFSKLDHLNEEVATDTASHDVTIFDDKAKKEIVSRVLGELGGVITVAVNTVMSSLHADGSLSTMNEASIIVRVNLVIESGLLDNLIQNEISTFSATMKAPDEAQQEILISMLPDIRKLMVSEISKWRETNSILLENTNA